MTTQQILETTLRAHRYLYYVKAEPVISDYEYDMLERRLQREYPESEFLNEIGSGNPNHYTKDVREMATLLLNT